MSARSIVRNNENDRKHVAQPANTFLQSDRSFFDARSWVRHASLRNCCALFQIVLSRVPYIMRGNRRDSSFEGKFYRYLNRIMFLLARGYFHLRPFPGSNFWLRFSVSPIFLLVLSLLFEFTPRNFPRKICKPVLIFV